jgi:hypothetical protein
MTFDQNFVSSPAQLPFLNNTLIDTHFITRDRTGRMVAFLARVDTNGWSPNNQPLGIGINEQTALITPDGQAQVVGNAKAKSPPEVDFFQTPGLPQVCQAGQPLTYSPILVDRLIPSGTFILSDWASSWHTTSTISVTNGVLTTESASVAANGPSLASASIGLESAGNTLTQPVKRVADGMHANVAVNDAIGGLVIPEKKKWVAQEWL